MTRWTIGAHVATWAIVAATFGQVVQFDYVNYDDPQYVGDNPRIARGLTVENIAWAFVTGENANWHPLTWISLFCDVAWFGPGPRGHHLTNLLLHLGGASLLLASLQLATGRLTPSWFVAILWAVHPLHAESAAWISERKGVLSTFFGLAALLAYTALHRTDQNRATPRSCWRLVAGLCYCLSLLSKQMWVTMPALLLLWDRWPLERLNRATLGTRLAEKLPYAIIAAVFCVVAFVAQKRGGAIGDVGRIPIAERTTNAVYSAATYLRRLARPDDLAPIYLHPRNSLHSSTLLACAATLAAGMIAAAVLRNRMPWATVGWFWYLTALLPVMGFVPIGLHGMADRYSDVPLIGIWFAAVWSIRELPLRLNLPVGFCFVAMTGIAGHRQANIWSNGVTLFEAAVARHPQNAVARFNLGEAYRLAGEDAKAMEEFRKAAEIEPSMSRAWTNLGSMQMRRREFESAARSFEKAISIQPEIGEHHFNLGTARLAAGDAPGAEAALRKALQAEPSNWVVLQNLAVAVAEQGRDGEAAGLLEAADLNEVDADYLKFAVVLLQRQIVAAKSKGDSAAVEALQRRLHRVERFVVRRDNR